MYVDYLKKIEPLTNDVTTTTTTLLYHTPSTMVLSLENEAIYAEDAVVAATIKGGGSEINPTLPDDLQSILTPSPSSHAPSSSNTSSNETALLGEVGYIFRKQFTAGWFTGKVIEIIADPGECYFVRIAAVIT